MIRDDGAVELAAFGHTDQGRRRPDNQDDFLIADLSAPNADGYVMRPDVGRNRGLAGGRFGLGPQGALLLVADGMGGAGGGVASRMATTRIHEELHAASSAAPTRSADRFAAWLRHALERANKHVYGYALTNTGVVGMGSTATAVGVLERSLYIGQVGDSRAYLVRHGTAIQLTRDQTMVQAMIDAGTLTEAQAELSSQRTALLQALGTAPEVSVDLTSERLRGRDGIVICSDGVFRVVRDDEIAEIVAGVTDVATACSALVDLANERGGPDNITAVVARLDGAGFDEPVGTNR